MPEEGERNSEPEQLRMSLLDSNSHLTEALTDSEEGTFSQETASTKSSGSLLLTTILMKAQRISSVTSLGREHESIFAGNGERATFLRLLMLTGVVLPPCSTSAIIYWISYLSSRFLPLACSGYMIKALATEPTYWNLWLYFPTFAACLTASFVQFKNLPTLARHILAGIAEEKEPEGAEDEGEEHDDANDNYYQNNHHRSTTRGVRMAQRHAWWFFVACVVAGGTFSIICGAFFMDYTLTLIGLFVTNSTTPVLYSLILLLGCDVNNARRHVQRCIARAEAQTLTRDDYTSTQEAVRRRSMAWAAPLACLGLVAFYNSVCFLVLQYDSSWEHGPLVSVTKDDGDDAFAFPNATAPTAAPTTVAAAAAAAYNAGDVSFDGIHAVCLGKELALLLVLMGIVMAINDEADAIGAELVYGGLWGEHGSPQEGRRLDLLALATTYGNREAALASVWAYATTPPVRPISFLLCGVRIKRTYLQAFSVSIFFSFLSFVLRRVLY